MGDKVDARVFALGFLRAAGSLPKERRQRIIDGLRSGVRGESDIWLDMANALEAMNDYNPFYEGAKKVPPAVKAPVKAAVDGAIEAAEDVELAVANKLDKMYQAAADEARKVAKGLKEGVEDAGWSLMPLALVALALAWSWGRVTR